MTAASRQDVLAVVDLGSNSFHLLLARPCGEHFKTVKHLYANTRLAAGVNDDGVLDAAYRERALATLRDFAPHIAKIPPARVHVVATHAVRTLCQPDAFLRPASAALGHAIDVISGEQEARLIWLGVASTLACASEQRLVIDIGGGSTEFILGQGLQLHAMRSTAIGCVTTSVRFFPDGELTVTRWQRAQQHLRQALQPFAARFREHGWQHAYGTSGSARAIIHTLAALDLGADTITATALHELRDRMLDLGHIDRLDELPLSACHHSVFVGGVAVMQAAFDVLGISHMRMCRAAMREGMLYALQQPLNNHQSACARRQDEPNAACPHAP